MGTTSDKLTARDKLFLEFPSMIEPSSGFFVWVLNIPDHQIFILEMKIPHFPKTNDIKVIVSNNKEFKLPAITGTESIFTYLTRLEDYIKNDTSCLLKVKSEDNVQITDILPQYRFLEQQDFSYHLSNDFKTIKIHRMVNGNAQFMEMILKNDGYNVTKHSLPKSFSCPDMFRPSRNFEALVQSLAFYSEQLEQLYTNLNTIDECCNVVEPVNATCQDTFRMLKLSDRVYMKFDVDPKTLLLTSVSFMGPTNRVESFRKMYDDNVEHWDSECDIYTNLLKVLGVSYMPFKSEFEVKENCNICLDYHSESGHIPYVTCENYSCNGVFHLECIKQWFDNLKGSKTFLAVVVGACPFCKAKLPASFAPMLDR